MNDTVVFAEYGGIITAAQAKVDKKFPDMTASEKNKKIKMSFGDGLPEAGQKMIIFASNSFRYQILAVKEPYYMLIGSYYGKFLENTNDNSFTQALPAHEAATPNALKLTGDDLAKQSVK